MAIVSVADILEFCIGRFTLTSGNDVLALTSDQGSASIDVPDGTYDGAELATALQTAMNANSTLTGTGTISFTVTYTTTTGKFTLDAGTGHTIALTHSTSDAATTFGFIKNHTAAKTITSDQPVPGNPESSDLLIIHTSLEAWFKIMSDYDFESTTYTNELYDGNGENTITLLHKPVTAVARLSQGRDSAIKIKNTSDNAKVASATVTYSSNAPVSLDLVVSGGSNEHSDELELSTYSTMSTLITAINALGYGWEAAIYDSRYNSLPSDNLLEQTITCTSWQNVEATYEHLEMAGEPVNEFRIYGDRGEIYCPISFTTGHQNVIVTYTAGYSSGDNMYENVKIGIMILCQHYWNKKQQDSFGVQRFSLGHLSITYGQDYAKGDMPAEAMAYLGLAKKRVIG